MIIIPAWLPGIRSVVLIVTKIDPLLDPLAWFNSIHGESDLARQSRVPPPVFDISNILTFCLSVLLVANFKLLLETLNIGGDGDSGSRLKEIEPDLIPPFDDTVITPE
jgi:hypothetical protein